VLWHIPGVCCDAPIQPELNVERTCDRLIERVYARRKEVIERVKAVAE